MEEKLYTIGHSNHDVEHFIELLMKNGVKVVVDVRSTPYSQYATQFNINEIKRINGLRYEALKGDLKGKNSIRLNDQYRAILTEDKDGIIILSVTFERITNHYA